MSRYTNPVPQYLDNAGDPVPNGKLAFFDSGTADEKNTFADVNQTIANTNPVELDGAGRAPNIFFSGTAKVRLLDENDAQIWERDPVGGEASESSGGDYDAVTVYGFHDIVRGSDDCYYQSIINNNQGNDPVTVRTAWSKLINAVEWNTNETYSEHDTARGSDGRMYRSLTDANTANDPTVSTATWARAVDRGEDILSGDLSTVIIDTGTDGSDAKFTGDLTGDVTGDVTGDLTGDVTGNADTATLATKVVSVTQLEQETGTESEIAVTPSVQQYHQSAVKAWVNFNGSTPPVIRDSYNVSSVTRTSTGLYVVNFTTPMADVNYAVTLASVSAGNGNIENYAARNAASVQVFVRTAATTSVVDSSDVSVMIMGTLS